jgi:hypothetical protein
LEAAASTVCRAHNGIAERPLDVRRRGHSHPIAGRRSLRSNIILAAARPVPGSSSSHGIYRSTDGGTTWTNTLNVQFAFTVFFHPTARNVAFAAGSGGIYKSIDGGATWSPLNGTAPNAITVPKTLGFNLALVSSSPNTKYAGNVSGQETYRGVDGGKSWVRRADPPVKECGGARVPAAWANAPARRAK